MKSNMMATFTATIVAILVAVPIALYVANKLIASQIASAATQSAVVASPVVSNGNCAAPASGSGSPASNDRLLVTEPHTHTGGGTGTIDPSTATNQQSTATNQQSTATNQSFNASGGRTDNVTRPEAIIYEMYEFVGTYVP